MGVSPGGGRHRPPEAGEIRKADGPGLRVVHPVLQRSGAIQINSRAKTPAPERFQPHGRLRCGNARRAREALAQGFLDERIERHFRSSGFLLGLLKQCVIKSAGCAHAAWTSPSGVRNSTSSPVSSEPRREAVAKLKQHKTF